ncbi:MAG: DM13 domain-containing protein [Alphaproteobacteria bacterium]|nr:DM13 domain-containing protein [Alphaproteobacteria bacterium]
MSATHTTIVFTLILLGIGGVWFASLHMSEKQKITSEQSTILQNTMNAIKNGRTAVANDIQIIATGMFNPNAEGSDALHRGWGGVSLVKQHDTHHIIFSDSFKVTNGPDYKLYLVPKHNIDTEEKFNTNKKNAIRVADVKQYSGMQIFTLPSDYVVSETLSIVIWCEFFSQFITTANLKINKN